MVLVATRTRLTIALVHLVLGAGLVVGGAVLASSTASPQPPSDPGVASAVTTWNRVLGASAILLALLAFGGALVALRGGRFTFLWLVDAVAIAGLVILTPGGDRMGVGPIALIVVALGGLTTVIVARLDSKRSLT